MKSILELHLILDLTSIFTFKHFTFIFHVIQTCYACYEREEQQHQKETLKVIRMKKHLSDVLWMLQCVKKLHFLTYTRTVF